MSSLEACLVYYLAVLQIKSLQWIDRTSWAPGKISWPCLFYPGAHLNVLVLWLCIFPTSSVLWHLHAWFWFSCLHVFPCGHFGFILVIRDQNTDSFLESLLLHIRSHSRSFQGLGSSPPWGDIILSIMEGNRGFLEKMMLEMKPKWGELSTKFWFWKSLEVLGRETMTKVSEQRELNEEGPIAFRTQRRGIDLMFSVLECSELCFPWWICTGIDMILW